ncbi:MAG: low-affinity phosphate transporter [Chrysothrix sp. TS-e1954]|nr:MAG: low-affinity phosphate transporter [Chrysothrix sp. TS-e1954]
MVDSPAAETGGIELIALDIKTPKEKLKPTQPRNQTGQLDTLQVYKQLREQDKEEKRLGKLLRLFGNGEMKFSHSVQFNAVPDWSSQYIAYSNLKKLIYTLEKEVNQQGQSTGADAESSPLLDNHKGDPDGAFAQALDHELEKIVKFYQLKEPEIFKETEDLMKDEEAFEADHEALLGDGDSGNQVNRRTSVGGYRARQSSIFKDWGFGGRKSTSVSRPNLERIDSDDSDDDADEQTGLRRTKTSGSNVSTTSPEQSNKLRRSTTGGFNDIESSQLSMANESGATLKKRMISLYVSLCELRSYVQLNKTGFSKVLKKYDKTLDRKLKQKYISEKVDITDTFKQETTDKINDRVAQIEQSYANLNTGGDVETAKRELRLDLREHVVWERNTVWREMIGIERKAQAANLGIRRTILGGEGDANKRHRQGDEESEHTKEVDTPVGRIRLPRFMLTSTFYALVICCVVFVCLLSYPIMNQREQQNCLALVVFVSLLWATEAIPLFVTSLLVPFLVVILRVVRTDARPHDRLDSKQAASYIFSAMWTPVIMLLLGGFTIAAALSKHNIAKMMATFVLSKAGTRPRNVLLTTMFVSMFSSMWISNVAAPVLCYSIIQSILRNLPPQSAMTKSLILGIALAANIGGAASPIASPQNLIALENMSPSPGWGIWFFIALPVCITSILLIWILLLLTLHPGRGTTIVPIRPIKERFTGTQWFIVAVTALTIGLWCINQSIEGIFGDMGVVAILPLLLFFGTGILTKEDFNNFLWTIIILASGGLALGRAVSSSGLLSTIASRITPLTADLSLYGVVAVFCALILVVASFVSHTVAALIILPLVREVGGNLAEPRPNLLVMASVLTCSAAMALPTTGFPNMTAVMMEDPMTGVRYLRVRDFITRGVPASVITFAVIVTLGFGLMRAAPGL